MTQKNCLDSNRIESMVTTAVLQTQEERFAELQKMAGRCQEPADYFADWLLRAAGITGEEFLNEPIEKVHDGAPSEKQWEFFRPLARKTALEAIALQDKIDIAVLKRVGAIARLPLKISLALNEGLLSVDELGPCQNALWAYVWYMDVEARESLVQTGKIPDVYSRPADYGDGFDGYHIMEGFCELVRWGFVSLPDSMEEKKNFLLRYARWGAGVKVNNGDVDVLINASPELAIRQFDNKSLQSLAGYSGRAAYELGRRRVLLILSDLQRKSDWMEGVKDSVARPASFEDAVELYRSGNDFMKHKLLYGKEIPGDSQVVNPNDPFGNKISKFRVAVGLPDYVPERFEDAVNIC